MQRLLQKFSVEKVPVSCSPSFILFSKKYFAVNPQVPGSQVLRLLSFAVISRPRCAFTTPEENWDALFC